MRGRGLGESHHGGGDHDHVGGHGSCPHDTHHSHNEDHCHSWSVYGHSLNCLDCNVTADLDTTQTSVPTFKS